MIKGEKTLRTFVVLGMHRSSTSAIAKGMADQSIFMGKPDPSHKHTQHYEILAEDPDFTFMNNKIMYACGDYEWYNPPPVEVVRGVGWKFRKDIKDLIRAKERAPFWGWKDPRTCLTIDAYLPHLTNPHFIVCIRNPLDVAKSLQRRNGFSIEQGVNLAKVYNQRVLDFLNNNINEAYEWV